MGSFKAFTVICLIYIALISTISAYRIMRITIDIQKTSTSVAKTASVATTVEQRGYDEYYRAHLQWCDQIYHQSVSCPLNGKIEVPIEVIMQQQEMFNAWCESIGFRNILCTGGEGSN